MTSSKRSERTPRYASTALDRILTPSRTVVTAGPFTGLSTQAVRASLNDALSTSGTPHLAVVPDDIEHDWAYDRDGVRSAVVDRPDLDTTDLGEFVTTVRGRDGQRRPLEVLVCGDYLMLDYSHGVGDGQFGTMAVAVLARGTGAGAIATALPRSAVWTAMRRHFLAHPGRLRRALALRGYHGADTGPTAPARRIANWEAAKCSIAAYVEPAQVDALRDWAKTAYPGATSASVTTALWLAALRAENVTVDDRVMVLMNCRRYLDPQYAGAHGNFAIGIPLRMPAPADPPAIAALVRDVVASGWPIVILAMAEIKAALGRQSARGPDQEIVEVPDRLRLAVSDLGRLSVFDGVEFGAGRPPQLAAFLEPDGPDAATLLVAELGGGRTFTASFCSEMIEPAVITRVLKRMCDDPVGLLSGNGGGAPP